MTKKAARRKPRAGQQAAADRHERHSRGRDRRAEILDEAVKLFAEKGFRGAGLTELAERVGMTHPGLLYYFGSKERLLLEAVTEREQRVESGPYLFDTEEPDLTTINLRDVARLTFENAIFTRLHVVLAAENLDPGDPLHEYFADRYERARRLAAAIVDANQKRGVFDPDVDARQTAFEIISFLMGLEIQWLMDPDRVDYLAVANTYTADLEQRIASRKPRRPR